MGKEFKLKTCIICGKAFVPTSGVQKTCSAECRRIDRNIYQKLYMAKLRDKKKKEDEVEQTAFYSKRAFDPVIEKAKNEHLSYGQAVAKMEKENGKEHMCNNMTSSRDRYDIDKNGDGYPDPTSYTAIRNIEGVGGRDIEGEKFGKLLHTIWNLCSLAGFEIQGRITIVSKETGRVWD